VRFFRDPATKAEKVGAVDDHDCWSGHGPGPGDGGRARLGTVFGTDDPAGRVQAAWQVKEQLRDLLNTGSLADAAAKDRLQSLAERAGPPETTRLWRTVCRWWQAIEVLIVTGATTAKVEANNTSTKHIKRTGRGFTNAPPVAQCRQNGASTSTAADHSPQTTKSPFNPQNNPAPPRFVMSRPRRFLIGCHRGPGSTRPGIAAGLADCPLLDHREGRPRSCTRTANAPRTPKQSLSACSQQFRRPGRSTLTPAWSLRRCATSGPYLGTSGFTAGAPAASGQAPGS
jgi:hypothetical protein